MFSEKNRVPVFHMHLCWITCHWKIQIGFVVNDVALGHVFSEYEENKTYG
jgi:hypothetical protein